jgi:hypothetical protein
MTGREKSKGVKGLAELNDPGSRESGNVWPGKRSGIAIGSEGGEGRPGYWRTTRGRFPPRPTGLVPFRRLLSPRTKQHRALQHGRGGESGCWDHGWTLPVPLAGYVLGCAIITDL